MSKSTNFVRKENTLTAKIVAEPRNLVYTGVPGGQGLGIFSPGIHTRGESDGPLARNTISKLAYEIIVNPGYVDAVTANDFRIRRDRFFRFAEEFTDSAFQLKVDRFFSAVEAGKEKLVTRYGHSVPRSQVEQLASELASQNINVGPCWRVVVHFNRCSTVPFDRSTRGRDGLYHRTDRTKVIWLQDVSEAQIVAMTEFLGHWENVTPVNRGQADSFVEVSTRRDKAGRFARDTFRRDARSGRVEAYLRPPGDPVRQTYKSPDPNQVDME